MITNILLSANGFKASFREVLVSADLLSSRRFLEGHIFEDLELLAVMAQGIRKAVSLPGRKYHYCYRKNNSSSRALRLRKDDPRSPKGICSRALTGSRCSLHLKCAGVDEVCCDKRRQAVSGAAWRNLGL